MRLEDFADDGCRWCGGEVPRDAPHSMKRIYCCKPCQEAHYTQIEKQQRRDWRATRRCEHCGKPLGTDKPGHARFCDQTCERSASRVRHADRFTITCAGCGTAFRYHDPSKAYCTVSCRVRASWAARRA